MPLVPHVTPSSVITSTWGNLVADHVVMRFTTAAQRTSQLTAPIVGQMTTLDDHPGAVYRWTGTAWAVMGGPVEVAFNFAPDLVLPLGGGGTLYPYTVNLPVAGTLIVNGIATMYRQTAGATNSSAVLKAAQASGGPAPQAGVDSNFQAQPDLGWITVPVLGIYSAPQPAGPCALAINVFVTALTLKLWAFFGTVRVQPA
jgi:hypothetical protein